MLIKRIASDVILDEAYAWLCHRRRDYSANSDIWSFRRNWKDEKRHIRHQLLIGRYRFDVLGRVQLRDGSEADLWSSRDAVVLKALSLCLGRALPVSSRCTHIRGTKGAVRRVAPRAARAMHTHAKRPV